MLLRYVVACMIALTAFLVTDRKLGVSAELPERSEFAGTSQSIAGCQTIRSAWNYGDDDAGIRLRFFVVQERCRRKATKYARLPARDRTLVERTRGGGYRRA